MVAAGGHERRGTGHERYELEAEHVAVEAQPPLQIADVQVHVADHEPRTGLAAWLLAGEAAGPVVVWVDFSCWLMLILPRVFECRLAYELPGTLEVQPQGLLQRDPQEPESLQFPSAL